ncbi:MAG: mechanosensitive ion channel domain-containing protein [Geitlerinemataceae cyanobacterium]
MEIGYENKLGDFYRRIGRLAIGLLLGIGWATSFLFTPSADAVSISTGNRDETAPIVVDGRVLFRIGSVEDFSAQKRARYVDEMLEQQIQGGQPISVEIAEQDGYSVLRLGDALLLTVTEQDVPDRAGVWLESQQQIWMLQQANVWKQAIDTALERSRHERSPAYLRQAALRSLGILAGAVLLYWGLTWLRRRLQPRSQLSRASQQFKGPQFWRLAFTVLQLGVWIAAGSTIAGLFPLTRRWRYSLLGSLSVPIVPLGEVSWSIVDVVLSIGLTIGLWFVVKGLTHLLTQRILRFAGLDRGVQNTVGLLTQYGLLCLGLLILFQSWGIDIASLTIIVSAFGLGIGFGLQNVASNFISGLIITFDRPIKVGDFLQVGELVGTVERIGSRSTEIVTIDQVSIIVPNSRFVDGEVINWSYGSPVSRLQVPVGIAYGSPITLVRKALLEAAKSHREVLRYPAPQVWLHEFGDHALHFELFVWIREPSHQFKIKSDLNYCIEASLRRYKIEIPFPQQDLHVRSPRLDDLATTWMKNHAADEDRETYLKRLQLREMEERSKSDRLDIHAFDLGEEVDLEALVAQMRGENGLDIRDRRYGLAVYSKTFLGSEAVEWLVRTQHSGKKAAVQLGQLLVDRGIIHHIFDEHEFKNEYLFYRFYMDES